MIAGRFEALTSYYAPLGAAGGRAALEEAPTLGIAYGRIRLGTGAEPPDGVLSWGERLPVELAAPGALVGAGDDELRRIEGSLAAFCVEGDRARLVTGGGPMTSLYVARGEAGTAWSTHAVAAAWLGHGAVELDPDAIPDLLALEYVPGERALVRGVAPVPPGTRVDFGPSAERTGSYWPRSERWSPVPADEAHGRAATALLRGLGERLGGAEPVHLGLTAGADSRVVACALAELGVPYETLTWGERGWADVDGAAEVASALGVPHAVRAPRFRPGGDEGLAAVLAEARWSEGVLPVRFVGPSWPEPMRSFVTGAAAETGRAFYYRRWAAAAPRANTAAVARRFGRMVASRLRGAPRDTRRAAGRRARELVWHSAEVGHEGWSSLDVLYGEQRVGHWARAHLPPLDAQLVPGFGTPEVMRALASLPLGDRISNAFHRRFVAARRPGLEPAEPPREPVPPRLRRAARAILPESLRAAGAGRRLARTPGARWLYADRWGDHGELRDWIAELALASPLVTGPMGERWAGEVRDGFLAGEARATSLALLAAAPAALDYSLGELR